MHEKLCSMCKEVKPRIAFYYMSDRKSHMSSRCKECQNKATNTWHSLHPEKTQRIVRRSKLKLTFDLTLEHFEDMLEAQCYCCAICGIDIDDSRQDFSVDHNHANGKVRGLLCGECNSGLGMFKDNQQSLQKAIDYLNNHN
jgi:hypothetical protein